MKFWILTVAAASFALAGVANAEYGHTAHGCGVQRAQALWEGYCDERVSAGHRAIWHRHFAFGHGCAQGCAQGCGGCAPACGPWDFARCGRSCGCRPFHGLFRSLHGLGFGGCAAADCGCSDGEGTSDETAPPQPIPAPTPVALNGYTPIAPSTLEEPAAPISSARRFGLWRTVHGE